MLFEYNLFARRIGLIAATNLLISLSGLILLPILTKTLPIEDYGTYAQITVTIGLVPAVVMLGLPYTMVRYLAATKERADVQEGYYSIAIVTFLTSGFASLILVLFAEPIAGVLFDGQVTVTRTMAAVIFLTCLNGLQSNYFRTFQHIKRYSVLTFSKTCIQLIFVGALVLAGYGLMGAVIGMLATEIVLFVVMGSLITSEIGLVIPKFIHIREYLSFGVPTVPNGVSGWIVTSSDRYIITFFLGTAFVGYYSPGYTLGNVVAIFVAPLSFLLPAVLSKYFDEHDIESVRRVLIYSKKYFLLLAIPSVVGLSLLSRPLLTLLSTSEIANEGYLVTFFVSLGALFFGVRSIDSQILVLEKKTMVTGKVWMLSALLNIVLNLILIPIMGIVGAAVATLISFAVAYMVLGHISNQYLVTSVDLRFIVKSCISASLMAFVLLLLNPDDMFGLALSIAAGLAIYMTSLFALKGISKQEIDFFKGMVFRSR